MVARFPLRLILLLPLAWLALICQAQTDRHFLYLRVGNPADATHALPRAGYALMGGGTDLDEAFRWLCERAGGGDFLVLRATGTDAYNPYIRKLCPKLNSVATLVVPSRETALDPEVARKIAEASALFIAGGDQANYINFWTGTPVQTELNESIGRGVPLGGTSAGLAVMGEWAYSAQGDEPDDADLTSALAMSNPFGPRITLVHEFLNIPVLRGILTDTHFAKRDRMGRLLVFLARLNERDGESLPPGHGIRGIGVDQGAAVLVEQDGAASVIGHGDAYFIDASAASGTVVQGTEVSFGSSIVQRVVPGRTFNLATWSGDGSRYSLSIQSARIHSTPPRGSVY